MRETSTRISGLAALALLVLFAGSPVKVFNDSIYVYYADISKHILTSGDWLSLHSVDGLYFRKPPLVFWLSAD